MLCENCGMRVNVSDTHCPQCGMEIVLKDSDKRNIIDDIFKEDTNTIKKKKIGLKVFAVAIMLIVLIVSACLTIPYKSKNKSNGYVPNDNVSEAINNNQHPYYSEIPGYIELADGYGEGRWHIVVVDDFLPFRKGPGVNYDIVYSVPNNTVILVIGFKTDSQWVLAEHNDSFGWVNSDYLKKTEPGYNM